MDLESHAEQIKSEREGEISYNIPYRWYLKRNDTNEITYKAEGGSQTEKTNLWSLGGREFSSVQFSSVAQLCPTLCDPMNCSMPGLPVHHQLLEFTQTHVRQVGDAIQPLEENCYVIPYPTLDIQSKEMKSLRQKEICIPMFIAALFTVALVQAQPQYLSTGDWIKTM